MGKVLKSDHSLTTSGWSYQKQKWLSLTPSLFRTKLYENQAMRYSSTWANTSFIPVLLNLKWLSIEASFTNAFLCLDYHKIYEKHSSCLASSQKSIMKTQTTGKVLYTTAFCCAPAISIHLKFGHPVIDHTTSKIRPVMLEGQGKSRGAQALESTSEVCIIQTL